MVGKRGQLTIFFILGIVLMSAFGFLLFARSVVVEGELKAQADTIIKEALQNSNINFYVQSCLDRVSDDAVYLLALQGGRLYKSQGGIYDDPQNVGEDFLVSDLTTSFYDISFYDYVNVSYAIKPNINNDCLSINPPDYPFINTKLDVLKQVFHTKSIITGNCPSNTGVIGNSTLPKLCEEGGANRYTSQGEFFGTCKFGYGDNSVQEQLQEYLSNSLKNCINFSVFENIGYNITVLNDPNSTVTFSDKFFTVNVTYPFLVDLGKSRVKTHADFEVKKNIRFKHLYEYVQTILELEYKDIHFNIESDSRNPTLGWDNQISLIRQVNPCIDCDPNPNRNIFDDIYQVIDNESLIRGNPLIFQFAIKNRAPILDYIDFGQRYNIVVIEGDIIKIEPFGKDPDENIVFYNYTGWREDFKSSFDEISCEANLADCNDDPSRYVINDYSEKVRNWTLSELFNDTKKDSEFRTTRNDLGLHFVEVWTEDEEGLLDFQNVSVMVADKPVVIPSGENPYSDIGPYNASIEDPYTLNAFTRSFFTNVIEFKWRDILAGVIQFVLFTNEVEITIPSADTGISYNLIEYITLKNFTEIGTRDLTVQGRYENNGIYEWTPETRMEVDVFACLPHRDEAAPYPYNDISEDDDYTNYDDNPDPFLANHTCCSDEVGSWGEITSGNICYEYEEFGYYGNENFVGKVGKFKDSPFLPADTLLTTTYTENGLPATIGNQDNDIWTLTFTRKCSGTRGNICDGTAEQSLDVATSCPDSTGPNERCSGPPTSMQSSTSGSNPGCAKYNGNTFEGIFEGGTGSCNYVETCSTLSGGIGTYNSGGDFFCNATCNGGGGCTRIITSTCQDCPTEKEMAGSDDGIGCTGGYTGTCGGGCIAVKNPDKTNSCIGSCPGSCKYEIFTIKNLHADPNNLKETCDRDAYDPDDSNSYCTGCAQSWIGGSCCGDDDDEFPFPIDGLCCGAGECVVDGACSEDMVCILP